jgi:NADH/F420H2 dehydrogenase subunit C
MTERMKTAEYLKNTASEMVINSHEDKLSKQEVLVIKSLSLKKAVTILKNELGFDMLMDVIAIDHQHLQDKRFELDYLFYSSKENIRVNLKVNLDNNEKPSVESLHSLYGSADWAERECFDMMGIHFDGHPNLKRLLMWTEFDGHPLRKDYPLDKRQPIPVLDELV